LHLISREEGAKGPEGKNKLVKDKSLKLKPRDASPMDVATPSGGKDRIEIDQGLCTREEEDVPLEAPWHSLT
jgi:hypothetical protein